MLSSNMEEQSDLVIAGWPEAGLPEAEGGPVSRGQRQPKIQIATKLELMELQQKKHTINNQNVKRKLCNAMHWRTIT